MDARPVHPHYPHEEWIFAAANGYTQHGYVTWSALNCLADGRTLELWQLPALAAPMDASLPRHPALKSWKTAVEAGETLLGLTTWDRQRQAFPPYRPPARAL